jgi:hypothetical protein
MAGLGWFRDIKVRDIFQIQRIVISKRPMRS